jgi:hypothetical protein
MVVSDLLPMMHKLLARSAFPKESTESGSLRRT